MDPETAREKLHDRANQAHELANEGPSYPIAEDYMKKSGLIAVLLALTSNMAFADGCPPPKDLGYPWSVGNVLFDKQALHMAYCRVVGNRPDWHIICTVNTGTPQKDNHCVDVQSIPWRDMGYEYTQYWADVNDDGKIDFCRVVGDPPNYYTKCILGPEFKEER